MSIFEPIIRRLKHDISNGTKCKIHYTYVGFNCKRKKVGGVKKCLEICVCLLRGEGGGSPTPYGKCHFEFSF